MIISQPDGGNGKKNAVATIGLTDDH